MIRTESRNSQRKIGAISWATFARQTSEWVTMKWLVSHGEQSSSHQANWCSVTTEPASTQSDHTEEHGELDSFLTRQTDCISRASVKLARSDGFVYRRWSKRESCSVSARCYTQYGKRISARLLLLLLIRVVLEERSSAHNLIEKVDLRSESKRNSTARPEEQQG